MASCCFPVLLLLLACVVWGAWLNCIATAHQGGCISRRVKFLPPKNGHYLEGHVFLNLTIGKNIPCQRRCVMERECVSVNIGPAVNDKIVCELSNSDHLQHPQDLKPRHDWNYRGNENLCATYPCLNSGKCYSGYTEKKYLCECPSGYTGENCEKDVNECKDGTQDCNENTNCTNIPGSFNCSCKKGYTGIGNLCSDVNECKDGIHDCDENANCTNIPGSFNCSCKKGYTGNGNLCSDVNECKDGTNDCNENADCTNIPGSFNCSCKKGYTGNGSLCSDVNECKDGTHDCHKNASCTNISGSFNCSCKKGYTGNGSLCSDVNECKDGTHDCDENANCTNIPGSFNCSCKKGYTGTGIRCSDIDECSNGTHDCHKNANCTNIPGSFNCSCKKGYTGNGSLCSDVNECEDGTHDCHKNANCTNIPGSFNCSCKKGYTGNGSLCSDIDECSNGTHDCHQNATCTNIPGSFNCSCYKDFIGDGRLCAVYKNCAELYKAGHLISGVYLIDPDKGGAFDVYCDQTGGGWTVFQKRLDGSVDFFRGWDDYKHGFGNLNGEYWLGLDKIHRLTKERSRLRVDLEETNGKSAYAEYDLFGVADEANKYNLSLGTYSGTAGDSLSFHRGMAFSTKDQDNDNVDYHCATTYKGAWWYKDCHRSNLNGLYHHGQHSSFGDGVNWYTWKGNHYSAKRAEMKIKPVNT